VGGGRDKRKKAKPKQPGAGADKTARKTEKNEQKAQERVLKKAQVTNARWFSLRYIMLHGKVPGAR